MSDSVALLTVAVRLDPMPGIFHDPESARECVEAILKDRIPHYLPTVTIQPEKD